jgi:hypothetical protein
MNERDQPADELERAPKNAEADSPAMDSFSESDDRAELATAYSRRSRRAGGPPVDEDAAPAFPSMPAPDSRRSDFRLRDFRPEGGSPAPTFGAPPVHKHAEPMRDVPKWTPPAEDDDGRLSYHTQAVPMIARPNKPAPSVVDSVPAEFAAPPRPMTRRELRELEAAQGTRPQADDEPAALAPPPALVVPPAPVAPPALVVPPAPVAAPAPVVPAAPVAAPTPAAAEDDAPKPPAAAVATPTPVVSPDPAELILPPVIRLAPAVPVPAPNPVLPAAPAPAAEPISRSPEPVVFTDASGAASPNRTPAPMAVSRGIDSAPEIFTAPDTHWSPQTHTEADAASKPGDSFFRTVGSSGGPLTTSALVIPSIPQASDITRPFSGTGEILVTGSIDLPMSLGSTGANPARLDHSDIDALFAQEDHDYAPTDAAPVRAIRAVSTHTSTHGVISAKKPASNRLPMMMAVTAGVLAVGVASLFAVGMIFGYF